MKKLEYSLRGLMWFLWNMFYVGIAAWVGEGQYDQSMYRFTAVFGWMYWLCLGAVLIEALQAPQAFAKMLTEDDA